VRPSPFPRKLLAARGVPLLHLSHRERADHRFKPLSWRPKKNEANEPKTWGAKDWISCSFSLSLSAIFSVVRGIFLAKEEDRSPRGRVMLA
jgi:hypothetical protein